MPSNRLLRLHLKVALLRCDQLREMARHHRPRATADQLFLSRPVTIQFGRIRGQFKNLIRQGKDVAGGKTMDSAGEFIEKREAGA